jgi:hypothetical protein
MTFEEFSRSLEGDAPPQGIPELVAALWYEARGDWDRAHRIAQEVETPDGSRVHAYLHRKEGDIDNARYWYGRAGSPECRDPLPQEWSHLARSLLGDGPAEAQ